MKYKELDEQEKVKLVEEMCQEGSVFAPFKESSILEILDAISQEANVSVELNEEKGLYEFAKEWFLLVTGSVLFKYVSPYMRNFIGPSLLDELTQQHKG